MYQHVSHGHRNPEGRARGASRQALGRRRVAIMVNAGRREALAPGLSIRRQPKVGRLASIRRSAFVKPARRAKRPSGSSPKGETLRLPRSLPKPRRPANPRIPSTHLPPSYWRRNGARRRPNGPWASSNGFSASLVPPLARARSPKSPRGKSRAFFAPSSHAAGTKPRVGSARPSARFSAMRSRPGAPRRTRPGL